MKLASSLAAAVLLLPAGSGGAQEFPNRTVRIVASQAGGGGDFIGRLLALAIRDEVERMGKVIREAGIREN
jgi:tripartite-type tricarboxylate transporter receptor subunit TctC